MKIGVFIALSWLAQVAVSQPAPVKGTWITNVGSTALLSQKNIVATVTLCKQRGLTDIFVVVWNNGLTMYPSKVVKNYIGIAQDPVYKGFDPIACIVEEGHKQGLKVHAWFEFGFSYAYKNSNSRWYKKYPKWAGKNFKGELLQKNGFYWWDALQPQVQQFMQQLVLEVVNKYPIDGIQGDDRLPAMPAEGGYNKATLQRYQQYSGQQNKPSSGDSLWLQWKANELSSFGKSLYQAVKKAKPNCIVSWAPSIYPWSKEQYLQDWPAWLNGGYADMIFPQLYRYDIAAYEKIIKELNQQLNPAQKSMVFPGILTALADGYQISDEMLQQIISLNRKYGFMGECHFYFESLKKNKVIYTP
jgi:uncharacterized lipoprotein YddW (UPF0748 family)